MSWTALIAEYLVVGSIASTWIALWALAAADQAPVAFLDRWQDLPGRSGPALALLLLVAIYALGTVVDHLCHLLMLRGLKRYNRWRWPRLHAPGDPGLGRLFHDTEDRMLGEEGRRERLNRRRGRIRIVRAAFLQAPLIGVGIYLHSEAAWPLVFVAVFWLLTAVALGSVHDEYLRMIARAAR